jgi:putative transport protein
METVVEFLAEQPLLLLFLVAAVGMLIGSIRIGSFSLGVAGVLFAGIAAGALDPRLILPELVFELGLAIFVYSLGLSAGPEFAASLRGGGARRSLLGAGVIAVGAVAVSGAALVLSLTAGTGAGLFTGVLTNTPALAGVVESLVVDPSRGDAADPVVAFSLAYPGSVIAAILAITLLRRLAASYPDALAVVEVDDEAQRIINRVVLVDHAMTVADIDRASRRSVVVARIQHGEQQHVADRGESLVPGDQVGLVGPAHAVEAVIPVIGELTSSRLTRDRSVLDFRRIIVSDRALVGRTIGELALPETYGALVTRVRRGDVDLVARPSLRLELGDRVRVVAPPARMKELTALFGDSYRALGEVDVATFSIGLALGLLLGVVPFPLPGGGSVSLGFAGGPLVVGLLLGIARRTGPFVWTLPYTAGVTLRQFGLVLFFAGIGIRAGEQFAATVATPEGLELIAVGFVISAVLAVVTLTLALRVLRMPFWAAAGLLAGTFTQPAALAFATGQSESEQPEQSYAAVAPMAILLKILLAQVVLLTLAAWT